MEEKKTKWQAVKEGGLSGGDGGQIEKSLTKAEKIDRAINRLVYEVEALSVAINEIHAGANSTGMKAETKKVKSKQSLLEVLDSTPERIEIISKRLVELRSQLVELLF